MTTTTAQITDLAQIVEAAQDAAALINETNIKVRGLRALRDVTFMHLTCALNKVNETDEAEALDLFFDEILLKQMTATDEQLARAATTLGQTLKVWNQFTEGNKMLELLFLIHLTLEIQEVINGRIQAAKADGNPKAHTMSATFRVEANMVVATLGGVQDRLLA